MSETITPVILTIMDGLGYRHDSDYNAVALAQTPVLDRLDQTVPCAFLDASGEAVGLPDGQPGNSEVGHLTIGAGRLIRQDLIRINEALEDNFFDKSPMLDALAAQLKTSGGTLHLMGLISSGGVHSHERHIIALAHAVRQRGVAVIMHLFTDGRDTLPKIADKTVSAALKKLPPNTQIGTVIGRYYAMDRDHRWQRTAAAWRAITHGESAQRAENPRAAITSAYARGVSDEFIDPTVIGDYKGMRDGDSFLIANFRSDRVRQLLQCWLGEVSDENISPATRPNLLRPVLMVSSSDESLDASCDILFPAAPISDTLGETVAAAGMKQLRLAETEKYAHVTFFLNGGNETANQNEDRRLIASPRVTTYDLRPEMSADGVLAEAIDAIDAKQHHLIIINFANPDMVGHSGDLAAAMKAVSVVDYAVGMIIATIEKVGGTMLLTADHGNCEEMLDVASGSPHTAHTTNKVPIYWIGAPEGAGLCDGGLIDLAPSLLTLLGLEIPADMTGRPLFI